MKRYLLFCGEEYESHGGMSEYCGRYNSIEEAREEVEKKKIHPGDLWYEIVDLETDNLEIVEEWEAEYYDKGEKRGDCLEYR